MNKIKKGMPVALISAKDKSIYAVLNVKDKYTIAIKDVAKKWFGTDSNNHPGVKRLFDRGPFCIGGKIHLIKRKKSNYKEYEFTPQQMRNIFSYKGWNKIAAFHTRNPIHRAHEFLQLRAIDKHNLDGVLLHPAIGIKNAGDFCSSIILESYNIMIENIYPQNQFVLGAFSGYSHYAGPREAVFTALVRKNFGCNFFIIGRDHTGVGDYYKGSDIKSLFNEIGEIGITPIFFNKVDYSKTKKDYVEIKNMGIVLLIFHLM